jgi:hypothetical protein
MATGYAGSTLQAELNRLANNGTYPNRSDFKSEAAAANAWLRNNWHSTVHSATTQATAGVYAAGTTGADGGTGVGATITASANAALVIDGHTMLVGERVLYWYNTDARTNGLYTVTNAGSAGSKWVITRSTDADNGARAVEVSIGDWFGPVNAGTANINKYFRMNAVGTGVNGSIVIGTDNITYEVISQPTFPDQYETLHALNLKADPLRSPSKFEGLNKVCNELAGTTGKSAVSALRSIDI